MKRTLPFLILVVVAVTGFRTATSGNFTVPAICTLDTASSNYTLERIEERLDATDTTTSGTGFRSANGLSGLTFSGISIVADSAKCAAGIQAYAQITYPTDAIKRSNFLAGVQNIFMVQLSPNRFVLNADISSPYYLIQHWVCPAFS